MSQNIRFEFNREKAIEAIVYIANNLGNSTYFSVGKILYYADKLSLERYGRFICGEVYYAMQDGPVPSHTYDLMRDANKNKENYQDDFKVIGNRSVVPVRKADSDEFSESDLICLNDAIEELGRLSYNEMRTRCHDAAWHKVWHSRGTRNRGLIPVEGIAEMFEDGEGLVAFLRERHKD